MEKPEVWDAQKDYPVQQDIKTDSNKIQYIISKIKGIEKDVEYCISTGFYYKMPFVLVKKECDKTIGLDMNTSLRAGENDLVDMTDLVVPYGNNSLGWVCDDVDITPMLDSMDEFIDFARSRGINIFYFEPIVKFQGNEIYKDFSNEKEQQIEAFLINKDIPYLRMQQALNSDNPLELEQFFYKTDHHWNATTGILADKLLCEKLNEEFGYSFDIGIFDEKLYSVNTLKNVSMGALGKKVTSVYISPEDFAVYKPLYDTDVTAFFSSTGKIERGKIDDLLLNKAVLDETNLYNSSKYTYYGHANQALVSIHNNMVSDGSHILMLKASFANCMFPFLAAVVQDLDVVDLRSFNGSILSYIEDTKPDTIVFVYDLSQYGKEDVKFSCFNFR